MPIIERLVVAYKLWQKYLPNFPQKSKYTLAQKIDLLFLEILESIFLARFSGESRKLSLLLNADAKLSLLKFVLQIAWEVEALETKWFALLSEPLDEIGRQLGGWIRKTEKETPTPR